MEYFWIVRLEDGNKKIPLDTFSKESVVSFLTISKFLNFQLVSWELHKIDDDKKETIIAHYDVKTETNLIFYDQEDQ